MTSLGIILERSAESLPVSLLMNSSPGLVLESGASIFLLVYILLEYPHLICYPFPEPKILPPPHKSKYYPPVHILQKLNVDQMLGKL